MSGLIKFCPFCGVIGKLEHRKIYNMSNNLSEIKCRIYCDNMKCPIQPSTGWNGNEDKILDGWNNRWS